MIITARQIRRPFVTATILVLALAATGLGTTRRAGSAGPSQAGPDAGRLHSALADLQRSFRTPPDQARIMMRWWWFGPSVTRAGIERELRLMKEGGIGGVEIQPVYPLALDDPASGLVTHPFLSASTRFASTSRISRSTTWRAMRCRTTSC